MKSLISIVMPVYNAGKYLPQSIESILSQTLKEIELICVNDGSSDDSYTVLKEFASKDSRVHIIDKKNAGVAQARNDGIKATSSDYIMFVDADDWIECDVCRIVYDRIMQDEADVVMWPYISETPEHSVIKMLYDQDYIFEGRNVRERIYRRLVGPIREELAHPELSSSLCPVWGKLYRKSLIESSKALFVDLSEIGTYEDGLFNLSVFRDAKKVIYINKPFYHYRKVNTQSITAKYNPKLTSQWKNLYSRIGNQISNVDDSGIYEMALSNKIALEVLNVGLNAIRSPKNPIKKYHEIRNILTDEQYQVALRKLDFSYFPIYWKFFYGCAKHRLVFLLWCLLIVIRIIIGR